MNKVCSKCSNSKSTESFRTSKQTQDGLFIWCKDCEKEYKRLHYQKNKVEIDKKNNLWKENHREEYDQYHRKYFQEHKDELKEKQKDYLQRTKNERNEQKQNYDNEKRRTDPVHKLKQNIRSLIRMSIKKTGYSKKSKTFQILGCTFEEFNDYLFENAKIRYPNFTTEDYLVKRKYHIDHIIPLSIAKTEDEVLKLNHYTNLQLLLAEDNNAKGTKLNWSN